MAETRLMVREGQAERARAVLAYAEPDARPGSGSAADDQEPDDRSD